MWYSHMYAFLNVGFIAHLNIVWRTSGNPMCLSSRLLFSRSYETKLSYPCLILIKNLRTAFTFVGKPSQCISVIQLVKSSKYFDFCRFINCFCFFPALGFSFFLAWQTLFKAGELFFGFFARIRRADACAIAERVSCVGARHYGYFQCVNPKGIGQHQSLPVWSSWVSSKNKKK